MSIATEDVKQIALAIATANGHPDPAGWAHKVGEAFAPPAATQEPTAEITHPENTLQPETPAV